MNTVELQSYLDRNNNRKIVMKVCAIDQLPRIKKNTAYGIVLNLSRSGEVGSHWTAIFIDKKRNWSYLDSYGFRPRGHHIESFRDCSVIKYNNQQLQQLSSKVCGMYASLFVLHMMDGGSVTTFTSRFSKNLLLNDLIVEKLYNINK